MDKWGKSTHVKDEPSQDEINVNIEGAIKSFYKCRDDGRKTCCILLSD